jgi:hypothetical protein
MFKIEHINNANSCSDLKRKILRLRGALTIPDRVVCRNSTVALD